MSSMGLEAGRPDKGWPVHLDPDEESAAPWALATMWLFPFRGTTWKRDRLIDDGRSVTVRS